MTLKSNIVVGAGGHSRAILENLYILNKKNIKVYDLNFSPNANKIILKNKVIDIKKILNKEISKKNNMFLAIGSNILRKKYFKKFSTKMNMPNLISNKSNISSFSKIGIANFFNHFSYVGPNSSIGDNNIINTQSLIEHDVKIGSHCHISPSVKIAGSCSIGDNVMCGIGTIIINNINICSNVTIGAGSIITSNIYKPGTYVTVKNKLRKL
ncbi:acetyltransferase [Candidatus Pelagibacter sp.]|nr:acetyltransferase [Candidatus Pelagibacter sp.]